MAFSTTSLACCASSGATASTVVFILSGAVDGRLLVIRPLSVPLEGLQPLSASPASNTPMPASMKPKPTTTNCPRETLCMADPQKQERPCGFMPHGPVLSILKADCPAQFQVAPVST